MSDTPKITKAEKSEKIKDPRKVEAGNRFAAISREAKERKARERTAAEKTETNTEDCCTSIEYKYIIGGVGVVAAVGGLYFAYKRDRREEASKVSCVNTANEVKPEKSACAVKHDNTKLDSFD